VFRCGRNDRGLFIRKTRVFTVEVAENAEDDSPELISAISAFSAVKRLSAGIRASLRKLGHA